MNNFALYSNHDGAQDIKPGERRNLAAGGLVWEHIEAFDADELARSLAVEDLPDVVANALSASETRPRCNQVEDGALVNLRGPSGAEVAGGDSLVSIRIWAHENRVITVSRRSLAATDRVETMMRDGKLADQGDLVAAFSQEISTELDPVVAALGEQLDDCESELDTGNIYHLRRKIASIRSEAIAYRRFIAPNRDALISMASLKIGWLADDDRLHVREAADRFARMAEELEAIRERAALIHEQLTDMRAELVDQRSLMIAIVAFIFLPLTFITGLLGMNVEGIPFAHEAWAFWGVFSLCVFIGIAVLLWFGLRHWLSK
ncbi:MAG: CorA family divalent cation transporter [Sphingomonadaceae bacterium]